MFACQWSVTGHSGHEIQPGMSMHDTEADAEAAAVEAARLHQHVIVFELDDPEGTRAMLQRAFERRAS